MGERLPEAWMVEWHRNGRVEFPLRRPSFLMTPASWVVVATLLGTNSIIRLLGDGGWQVGGYLLIAVYGSIYVVLGWQLITRRPVLVVDRRGVHVGRTRSMSWAEIGSISDVTGAKMARHIRLRPKNVWAKDVMLSQQHVNDLQSFRDWLDELLVEQRPGVGEGRVD